MRICSVEDCEARHSALGYCRAHYRRLKVYGDPLGRPEPRPWEHGTANGYNNHRCRCDECRHAWTAHLRVQHAGSCARCGGRISNKYESTHCSSCWELLRPKAHCGTESGYSRGCRCDDCRAAATSARRRRRREMIAA